jgi:UDP-N-acetyl-2-amino-2-deoxyglucuronate dehydrogenase
MGNSKMKKNFVLIGAAGYIAPRHMKAIHDLGHELVAVCDPCDSIGVLDSYFPNAFYFKEFERFDRHLEKLKREGTAIDYVSICSPNYLHDAQIRYGLKLGADVICEKPIVLNPWNIDGLVDIERETGKKVYTILQLRHHPVLMDLKKQVVNSDKKDYKIKLNYITARGNWYQYSWKGDVEKSGGIATNIGIHFFDILTWIFGNVISNQSESFTATSAKGKLTLEKAEVEWNLSIDEKDLPLSVREKGQRTYRSMRIDDRELEFSEGFADLHTTCYQAILDGKGSGLEDVRESVNIVSELRG